MQATSHYIRVQNQLHSCFSVVNAWKCVTETNVLGIHGNVMSYLFPVPGHCFTARKREEGQSLKRSQHMHCPHLAGASPGGHTSQNHETKNLTGIVLVSLCVAN